MRWLELWKKLQTPVHPAITGLAGTCLLALLYSFPRWLNSHTAAETSLQTRLALSLEGASTTRERLVSMEMLKRLDLEKWKADISGSALSQKTLFESGLSLQEERRLLEKQLEIMTTYLVIDPSLQRVFLMREAQPLQSYLLAYFPLKSFGDAPDRLPAVVKIISKERFAHPDRGKSEEVDGRLQYVPPQVGTSVRSNALGEFVMFTNSALILHGPPLNPEDHERYPHICLGLDREAARKLYRGSFIGTKIALHHISIEKAAALLPATTSSAQQP